MIKYLKIEKATKIINKLNYKKSKKTKDQSKATKIQNMYKIRTI